jgi:hypothetical protein
MNEKELLFEVEGVKIFKGSIYICKHKEDLSAPTGFQEKGTTKLPSDGADNSFQCGYFAFSETEGVWDTGLHEYSQCYGSLSEEVAKEKVKLLQENLVKPYEKHRGKVGLLAHTNDEFWSKHMFKISADKVFNTNNPEDLLTLYMGLLTRELTPKGQEGNSKYRDSAFVLVDETQNLKKKDERSSNMFEAIGVFEELLKTDRQKLLDIFSYMNIVVSPDIEDGAFRSMVREYFDQITGKNVDVFMMNVEEANTDFGRDRLAIFVKLKEALKRGNTVTANPNNILYYNETEIGPDLRSAAHNIAKTKEFESIKKELLLGEKLTDEN